MKLTEQLLEVKIDFEGRFALLVRRFSNMKTNFEEENRDEEENPGQPEVATLFEKWLNLHRTAVTVFLS